MCFGLCGVGLVIWFRVGLLWMGVIIMVDVLD